jgi:hypothetical protein
MSLYTKGPPGPSSPAIPPVILTGRFLAHAKLSKAERAFLGVDVLSGKAQPVRFTHKQVATLVGVSIPTLVAAKHVVIDQPHLRPEIEAGRASLSKVRSGHPVTDREVDRFITRAGADAVLAGLDRYTAPRFAFAAE